MNMDIVSPLKEDVYIPEKLIIFYEKCKDNNVSNSLMISLDWDVKKTIDAISKCLTWLLNTQRNPRNYC